MINDIALLNNVIIVALSSVSQIGYCTQLPLTVNSTFDFVKTTTSAQQFYTLPQVYPNELFVDFGSQLQIYLIDAYNNFISQQTAFSI